MDRPVIKSCKQLFVLPHISLAFRATANFERYLPQLPWAAMVGLGKPQGEAMGARDEESGGPHRDAGE